MGFGVIEEFFGDGSGVASGPARVQLGDGESNMESPREKSATGVTWAG
jgi:hypothetical protein